MKKRVIKLKESDLERLVFFLKFSALNRCRTISSSLSEKPVTSLIPMRISLFAMYAMNRNASYFFRPKHTRILPKTPIASSK